jgi:hypothetical protein
MDQTLVRSGYDLEIALGERYLQYLLLLALDAGVIPIEFTVDHPAGPIHAILTVPTDIDRTYSPDPDASGEPAPGALDELEDNRGFQVEVLFNDPLSADLKITVRAWFTRTAPLLDVYPVYSLFVKIRLETEPDPQAHGLATVHLSIELVDVKATSVSDAAVLAQLKPRVDRTLDLGALVRGHIDAIALRKFPATTTAPAALSIYLNLMLRSGPAADHFLPARGDVLLGENILPPGEDLAFASRWDLYSAIAADAWYRRAVPSGPDYAYPLHFRDRSGTLLNVTIAPTTLNRLQIKIKAEIEVNNLPNPDVTLVVDLYAGVDGEGVMTWESASNAYQSGLIYDVVEVLLGGFAAAIVPIVGPVGALLILHYTEEMIADSVIGDKVEKKIDATLLDITPTRLTLFRKRWDPFFETQHQLGIRPSGTLITTAGIAFWGRAVLTRATTVVHDVVIRDSEHVGDEAPTALRYRVHDIDQYPELDLDEDRPEKPAAGADRRPFTRHDPVGEPYLFQITVDGAIERITEHRLLGAIPYTVERIEAPGQPANKFLVISRREFDEQRNRLIAEHVNAVTPQIVAEHEAEVRAQVLADFAEAGLFPTSEEIEAAVAAGIQPFIDASVDAYREGALPSHLDAALRPLLLFELAQTHFGKLQQDGILVIKYFDLVHVPARSGYYYRDRYVPALEHTAAKRKADNLHSKPRYRSTAEGPVFL